MAIFQRGATYYTDIGYNGERIKRSLHTTDRKEAQRRHDEIKAELWRQPKFTGKTWNDALIKWLKAKPRGHSDQYALRAFPYQNRDLRDCTVESFQQALATLDIDNSTYNRYISRIHAILNLSGMAIKIPRKDVTGGRIRFLTKQEWDALYEALAPHLKPLCAFALYTGLRRHNVTHLEWQDVDLTRRTMWVWPFQAKAAKAISVPLSDEAVTILQGQRGVHDKYVFAVNGKPIYDPKTGLAAACRRAGVTDFSFHCFRHTFASWHVMSGTDLGVLQALGGWASIKMVQRYAHLDPGYLAKYANNMKPYDPSI